MTERRAFGLLGVAALVAAVLVPTYPNYDTYFSLVWGQEILHGHAPSFDAYAASTEHPLWVAWSTLADLVFGGTADRALVLTCVAAFVALVWATYRVGRACFDGLAGVVAALAVGSSFAFLLYAARGYVDVPYLALVVWAGALEAQRPRRGVPVMALLALAGLLRPEAWILAGAYWLWCGPRDVRLFALAAAAPVLWCLTDLVVTGDPLFSLHSTSDLARALGRERGLAHVPRAFVSFLADTARPPVLLIGIAGLALAWRDWRQTRASHASDATRRAPYVPLALLAGGTLAFVGSGAVGLSILPRYLTVPTVAICLYAGHAVSALRARSARAVVALGVLAAVFLVVKAGSFGRLAGELRFIHATHVAVADTAADPHVRAARRCGPVTLPTYRLIPDLRFELESGRGTALSRGAAILDHMPGPTTGVALVLHGTKAVKRFGKADGSPRGTNVAPPGFAPLAQHGMLRAYASCLR